MELVELKKELTDFTKTVTDTVKGEVKNEVKALADKLTEAEVKYAKSEDVAAFTKSVDDLTTSMAELKQVVAQKGVGNGAEAKSFAQVLEQKLKDTLGETKDSDKRREIKSRFAAKNQSVSFDVKAAVNMTRALINPTSGSRIPAWQREGGVGKAPDNYAFVTDLVTIGTLAASDTISWVERVSRSGGATSLAEGAAYGKLSMDYQEFSMKAQKLGVMAKFTKEALDDIDFLASEIQNEIVDGQLGLNYTLDQQLLAGDGTAPNLKGILGYAIPFVKPVGLTSISQPSNFDVIRAVALQGALSLYRFSHILLNPTEVAKMELTKDTNGNYIIPPFIDTNGRRVGGLTIVENTGIAAGTFLAGDFSKSGLFVRKGLEIMISTENEDDFNKDFISIKGSIRAVHRIKGTDANAFVKGTFAPALTALAS